MLYDTAVGTDINIYTAHPSAAVLRRYTVQLPATVETALETTRTHLETPKLEQVLNVILRPAKDGVRQVLVEGGILRARRRGCMTTHKRSQSINQ